MKKSYPLVVAAVAIMGAYAPNVATAAQPPFLGAGIGRATTIAQDVALDRGGKLAIQVVDVQGKPRAGTPITVRYQGDQVHHSVTGQDGQVVLSQPKPGIYQITSGSRGGIYRLWAPGTAPPKAGPGILLIDQGGVVRGSPDGWQKAAVVSGVIITSGVVGGVIGYNLKDAS